ncbi:MAG: response regulator transcription factor [Bacteroidetes bacterium]|nr:response regulator transcription factor [Bacteroidota bacterium]
MNISPNTIRNHISNIYKKLHVTSKVQAIKVYMNNENKRRIISNYLKK